MKLNGVLIASLIFLLATCSSSKTTNREKITVSPYTTIVSSAGIEVYFSQGRSHTADIDKENKINASVKNGTLVLSRKSGRSGNAKVYLTANKLESIVLSGGSRFFCDDLKNSDKVAIAASGGSNVDIKKLKSANCNIAISGGSNSSIKDVKSDRLNIASSGGSIANIDVKKAGNVNLAASGGSNITMMGNVGNISVSSSGAADVNIVNLKYKTINTNTSGRGNIRK